jgi:hypothetical protein
LRVISQRIRICNLTRPLPRWPLGRDHNADIPCLRAQVCETGLQPFVATRRGAALGSFPAYTNSTMFLITASLKHSAVVDILRCPIRGGAGAAQRRACSPATRRGGSWRIWATLPRQTPTRRRSNWRLCSPWVHLNHGNSDDGGRSGDPQQRGRNENPFVDCSHGGRAWGWQHSGDYEQRLQEQPSHMVRSKLRHPAPREDLAQLGVPLGGGLAPPATGPRRRPAEFACRVSLEPTSGYDVLETPSELGEKPHAWFCDLCHGSGDLLRRVRCCAGAGDNSKRHSSLPRTFNPRHFNCHELHDAVQLAGRELSNRLRHSRAAHGHARLWNRDLERVGEHRVHDGLHFKPASMSDKLRPQRIADRPITGFWNLPAASRPAPACTLWRGSRVASSGASRLKPEGINVHEKLKAVYWFLNDKSDVPVE